MSSPETHRKTSLAAHEIREVAVAADADPRTVRKLLLGEPVQALARRRIERALLARQPPASASQLERTLPTAALATLEKA